MITKVVVKQKGRSSKLVVDRLIKETDELIRQNVRWCDKLAAVTELILKASQLGDVRVNREDIEELYNEVCENDRYEKCQWSREVIESTLDEIF